MSMASSDLWVDNNSRLQEIFMITEKPFAALSVMTVGIFLGKIYFFTFF